MLVKIHLLSTSLLHP